MSNTYSQINIHCIFSVEGRANLLRDEFRLELFKYIAGVMRENNVFSLAVGGWTDHVHVFFELPTHKTVSEIMRIVKTSSTKWINSNRFVAGKFSWQSGYAAFSYSKRQRDGVINYIMNQEEHHRTKTFREEYIEFLELFNIDYDPRYIFEFYED